MDSLDFVYEAVAVDPYWIPSDGVPPSPWFWFGPLSVTASKFVGQRTTLINLPLPSSPGGSKKFMFIDAHRFDGQDCIWAIIQYNTTGYKVCSSGCWSSIWSDCGAVATALTRGTIHFHAHLRACKSVNNIGLLFLLAAHWGECGTGSSSGSGSDHHGRTSHALRQGPRHCPDDGWQRGLEQHLSQ